MKKRTVVILGIVLIAIAASSVAAFVWQIGTIDYWLNDTLVYQLVNGQWQTVDYATNDTSPGIHNTINCRNDGFTTASFDLTISFKNAIYIGSPDTPTATITTWNKISDTTASYSFIVPPHSTQSIIVNFQIANNTQNFNISLSFNSGQSLHVESAQKGAQPWQTVYRTLFYGQGSNNTYVAAHIS
jgi:hypothetical protein